MHGSTARPQGGDQEPLEAPCLDVCHRFYAIQVFSIIKWSIGNRRRDQKPGKAARADSSEGAELGPCSERAGVITIYHNGVALWNGRFESCLARRAVPLDRRNHSLLLILNLMRIPMPAKAGGGEGQGRMRLQPGKDQTTIARKSPPLLFSRCEPRAHAHSHSYMRFGSAPSPMLAR